jgi:hypothetical protein
MPELDLPIRARPEARPALRPAAPVRAGPRRWGRPKSLGGDDPKFYFS